MSTIVFNTICAHNVYKATQSDSKQFRATLSWSRTSKDFESCFYAKISSKHAKIVIFQRKIYPNKYFSSNQINKKKPTSCQSIFWNSIMNFKKCCICKQKFPISCGPHELNFATHRWLCHDMYKTEEIQSRLAEGKEQRNAIELALKKNQIPIMKKLLFKFCSNQRGLK